MKLILPSGYATDERGNQTIMNKAKRKLTLSQPATCQIKVPGEFDEVWLEWVGMIVSIASEFDRPGLYPYWHF